MNVDPRITSFFAGNPIRLELFQAIRGLLESIGEAEMKVTRSQISFRNTRQFAWVWLPQPWDKKRPPNSLVLSFSLGRKVENPAIVQAVEPYPGRWMHHVIIEKATDLDERVHGWLTEAYEFGAGRAAISTEGASNDGSK